MVRNNLGVCIQRESTWPLGSRRELELGRFIERNQHETNPFDDYFGDQYFEQVGLRFEEQVSYISFTAWTLQIDLCGVVHLDMAYKDGLIFVG